MDNQSSQSEFELRSWLRRRDAWRRRQQIADAHVRQFCQLFPPLQRGMWNCPRCEAEIACRLRPRDVSGRLLKHCGCGSVAPSPVPRHLRPTERALRIAYKRQKRVDAAVRDGRDFKPRTTRHAAHVDCWRGHRRRLAHQLLVERQRSATLAREARYERDPAARRYEQFNKGTRELSDGFVSRLLRKNMPSLKGVKLPHALIDLKRAQLMILREVKNLKGHDE